MLDLLLNMLTLLGIIVVALLILSVVAIAVYAVGYIIYTRFAPKDNDGNGRG